MNRTRFAICLAGLLLCTPLIHAAASYDTALLVVDVQANILTFGAQNMQTIFRQPILEQAEAVVETVRAAGLPIIYLKFLSEAFVSNPDMVRVSASVAPAEGDAVLARSDVDPFANGELDALLREQGITNLLVCGIYSTCCVNAAILSAVDLGYTVTVVEDGHGDHINNMSLAIDTQATWVEMSHVTVAKLADIPLPSPCEL